MSRCVAFQDRAALLRRRWWLANSALASKPGNVQAVAGFPLDTRSYLVRLASWVATVVSAKSLLVGLPAAWDRTVPQSSLRGTLEETGCDGGLPSGPAAQRAVAPKSFAPFILRKRTCASSAGCIKICLDTCLASPKACAAPRCCRPARSASEHAAGGGGSKAYLFTFRCSAPGPGRMSAAQASRLAHCLDCPRVLIAIDEYLLGEEERAVRQAQCVLQNGNRCNARLP